MFGLSSFRYHLFMLCLASASEPAGLELKMERRIIGIMGIIEDFLGGYVAVAQWFFTRILNLFTWLGIA